MQYHVFFNPDQISIYPVEKNTDTSISNLLKQYKDMSFSKDFIKYANKISQGNPSIVEQMVLLKKDANSISQQDYQISTIDQIIEKRLNILKKEDKQSYRMLVAMSILGSKFYPAMLECFDNISPQDFERIIYKLIDKGYITQLDSLSFEFKTYNIWKSVVNITKNDDDFEEILNILYEILSIYKQSSVALLAYIVQKLNNNDQAFSIWTLLIKQAAYIGDIALYIIVQRQAYKLIENKNSQFYLKVKKNIHTRIGKLLEPIDHIAAFEHLQNAIMMLEENEENEHIELLGYLASCAMKSGNFCGVIECIDSVLNKIPESSKLEKTLASKGIGVIFDKSCIDYVLENGYSLEYGARPLRDVIRNTIIDMISDRLIAADIKSGDNIRIFAVNNEIDFEII